MCIFLFNFLLGNTNYNTVLIQCLVFIYYKHIDFALKKLYIEKNMFKYVYVKNKSIKLRVVNWWKGYSDTHIYKRRSDEYIENIKNYFKKLLISAIIFGPSP